MAKRLPPNPNEALEYGHWNIELCGEFDPRDNLAFVYAVHLKDGCKYIGVKKFWQIVKKPPNEFVRGPNRKLKEHKWRSYNTSSSILKETLEDEIEERYILGVFSKWGTALMAEFIWQFELDALRQEHFLNFQMGGTFTRSTYPDELIYERIDEYKKRFKYDL